MHKNKILIALLAFCTLLISCKPEDVKTFTFTNELPQQVTVNIYNTEADYLGNKNMVYSGTVDASGKLDVPYSVFKSGAVQYYIDWYSADYEYSNWNEFYTTTFKLTPTENGSYTISPENNYIGLLRKIMLNGNGTGSTWKTTGSFDNNAFWNSLSEENRAYEFVFDKSVSVAVTTKNQRSVYDIGCFGYKDDLMLRLAKTINSTTIAYLSFRLADNIIPANTNKLLLSDLTGQSSGPSALIVERQ